MAALDGRVALVTGAGRGIGRAVVHELVDRGARVMAVARSEPELRGLGEESGAAYMLADLAEARECERVIDATASELGRIDILVNNAAVGSLGEPTVWELDPELWAAKLAINLDAPFLLTRRALPAMIERGWGRVVMVASTAGQVAWPGAAYCASKHGLLGLMRSVALDVGPHGVTCNAVCPGTVRTEMGHRSAEWAALRRGVPTEEVWAERAAQYPSGRVLDPQEVAAAVCFLADPSSSGINGEALTVAQGGLR